MAITDPDSIISIVRELNNLNVNVSIDDFGTGNTSLTFLKDIRVDLLKIDRSFLTDLNKKVEAKEILDLLVSFAKTLNIAVLAEGVETEEQLNILREIGCQYVQGFLFAHPMTKGDTYDLLLKNKDT